MADLLPCTEFGPYRYNPNRRELVLRKSGAICRELRPKQIAALHYLLQKPDNVVEDDELIDACWDDRRPGNPATLHDLRQLMGPLKRFINVDNTYIERVRERGYKINLFEGDPSAAILGGGVAARNKTTTSNSKFLEAKVYPEHRSRLGFKYDEAFESGTQVFYLSIMSQSRFENMDRLLKIARSTKTKLKVLTWRPSISKVVVEAFRQHLNEHNHNPKRAADQVREAAHTWRGFERRYKRNLEVRYYASSPTLQGIVVKDKWAVIELLPFHTSPMARPAFYLEPASDSKLFKLFSEKVELLWDNARRARSRAKASKSIRRSR